LHTILQQKKDGICFEKPLTTIFGQLFDTSQSRPAMRSSVFNLFSNRCPHCQKGHFFVNDNPYSRQAYTLHEHCDHCGQSYSPEPGFYYGAMYMSYTLSVAMTMVTFWLFIVLLEWDAMKVLIGLIVLFVVLQPVIFRLSRAMWAHLFIRRAKD
jgi:uncharacterized protein (DUF983 family)